MKIRHFSILLSILASAFGVFDVLGVDVWMPVIVAYLLLYLPIAVVLFILSWVSRKKDSGLLKNLDNVGLFVSVSSVLVTLIYFLLAVIVFYD